MLGQEILDYIDARIVLEELSGNYTRHNKHGSFHMIILNHVIPISFNIFKDLTVECLFYTDDSGGQVKVSNCHEQTMEFLKPLIDLLDMRVYRAGSYYTLYIDEHVDEKKVLGLLKMLYGAYEINAVS